MVGLLTRSVCLAWAGNAFIVSSRQSSTNNGGYSGSRGYNSVKSFCSLGLHVPTGEAGDRSHPGTAGTGRKAGFLMTTFLDNWEDSNCWDVQAPESQGHSEVVASDVSRPRPAPPAELLASKPELLVLAPGALLAMLDTSVRYVNSQEAAERAVEILVEQAGHFGLDVETAKLI